MVDQQATLQAEMTINYIYLITQNPVPELQSFKCNFWTGFEISSNINTMLTISLQLVHDHSTYQAEAPSRYSLYENALVWILSLRNWATLYSHKQHQLRYLCKESISFSKSILITWKWFIMNLHLNPTRY